MDQDTLAMIRKQCEHEVNNYSQYHLLSFWFYNNGYKNLYNFATEGAKEELEHFQKFSMFLNKYEPITVFPTVNEKVISYESFEGIKQVLEYILVVEQRNTEAIQAIAENAMAKRDYITYNFLNFFLTDQFEGEKRLEFLINIFDNNISDYDYDMNFEHYLELYKQSTL